MLGKKDYQEKLYTNFQLSQRIPKDNFYRRLKEFLNLSFLYKLVEPYYGKEGQKSIDQVVFFKLMLVSYLENIIYDRQLIDFVSMRLDILYFLNYDIDEELPWHSTISRTRKLFPKIMFEGVFNRVLKMCVESGMVAGHTQAIDSAYIKAKASLDSIEKKQPKASPEDHIAKTYNENKDEQPRRKAKQDKSNKGQRTI
jgi:transposase